MYRREELVHGHLDVVLVESREEQSFQVNPRINGVRRETPKLVKGYPFENVDEQSSHDGIIVYYITGLRLEVIDVLVGKAFAIIRVQCRWLELWRVLNRIPS